MKNTWKIAIIFGLLFIIYHCAEYMIVFKNNPVDFFLFQGLFFILAWIFGNWYTQDGLTAWGMPFKRKAIKLILWGLATGIFLYGLPFAISLLFGVEQIIKIPNLKTIFNASLPFAIGVLFSSFSEDILTRGIVYKQFHKKVKPHWLAIGSALVYLLNHIYRLADGPESWSYIFLLGIILIIPVIITKNLWFTGAMHWSGNLFFYITHNVILTESQQGHISPNYLFAICLLIMIPIIWLFTKYVNKQSLI